MKYKYPLIRLFLVCLLAALSSAAGLPSTRAASQNEIPRPAEAPLAGAMAGRGPMLIENVGQFPERVRFQVHGRNSTIWLTEEGIWLTILAPESEGLENWEGDAPPHLHAPSHSLRHGVNLKISFPGANPRPRLEPFDRLGTRISYLIGDDPNAWRTDVPAWGGVRYVDLYPGLDLEISLGKGLDWRWVVRGTADLSAVRLRVEGADGLRLHGGRLHLTTRVGESVLPLPALVAPGEGVSAGEPAVVGDVILRPFSSSPLRSAAAASDQPPDLLYSTLLGGSAWDGAMDVAVDEEGYAYVTGGTKSPEFPTRPGAFQSDFGGSEDVFVVKVAPSGGSLAYATFIGGSDGERGRGIAIDDQGYAYVTGDTASTDFPTTDGAFDRTHGYYVDAFVLKLDPSGGSLSYATFLGGSARDYYDGGSGIGVDDQGYAYVTGWTGSSDFPTTSRAFDISFGGYEDAFIVKLNPSGSDLSYAAFVGGSSYDEGSDIAVDGEGYAYVTGWTRSSDFPTTRGAFDRSVGEIDAFVSKVNPSGRALSYATFLGGTSWDDRGRGIAIDGAGHAYVTGQTCAADFPATDGAFDTSYNGWCDVFIAKISPSGDSLSYATFVGGKAGDEGNDIAVDGAGYAYVTGVARSSDFPRTVDAFDITLGGDTEAFALRLDPTGSSLIYATFLGGSDGDWGQGIAADDGGSMHVVGSTRSADFPTTSGAFDETHDGDADAFVTKLQAGTGPAPPLVVDIAVTGLEITQGIQNLANDMPLVEGRRTYVRAYVQSDVRNVDGVRARLRAFRDGVELDNSPREAYKAITVRTDGGNRLNLDDSFWFSYLPQGWCSGTVTFRVEVNYDNAIRESETGNNVLEQTVTFHEGEDLNVVMIPLHLHERGRSSDPVLVYDVTAQDFHTIVQNLYRYHPIAELNLWHRTTPLYPDDHDDGNEWNMLTDAGQVAVLSDLRDLNFWTWDPADDLHYIGMVHPNVQTGNTLGRAIQAGSESWVQMISAHAGWPNWYIVGGATMAHELGHNEGLLHVACADNDGDGNPDEAYPDPDYPWPYPNCSLAAVDADGYYGFDVYHYWVRVNQPTVISNDPNAAEPHQAFPLMGYKDPVWISPYEYCKLLVQYDIDCTLWDPPNSPQERLREAVLADPLAFADPDELRALQQANEYLAVSGFVDLPAGTVTLDDVYRIETPPPDALQQAAEALGYRRAFGPQAEPSYTLVQVGADGSVLDTHEIFLPYSDGEGNIRYFLELVPMAEGTTRVQVRQGETVLAERVASANPPTVQVVTPNGGEHLSPGATVRWTASDPDGDRLTFNVLYSADNGQTWRLIAKGLTGDHFEIPSLDDLPGSDQGRMRVIANDGFHTAQDDSDGTFTVPGAPPLALILEPGEGATIEPGSLVIFAGLATDVEDGPLPSERLAWHSDRDGDLGVGEELPVDTLSTGQHLITLTATDSDGETGTATITIFVGYRLYLPLVLRGSQ